MMNALLLALFACGGASSIEVLPREAAGESVALAYLPASVLELPDSSRVEGAEAPRRMPLSGPFKLVRTVDGVQTWEAPLPVRPRNLFFSRAPSGMVLFGKDGKPWEFGNGRNGDKKAKTWDFTSSSIFLRTLRGDGPPDVGDLELAYPRATERSSSLNLKESGLSKEAFVSRSVQLHENTRHGLLLPAPARAEWELEIPPGGVLDMDAVILPPEAHVGVDSDGAQLRVEWESAGLKSAVASVNLRVDHWERLKVDLSAYEGQKGVLRLRTEPGDDASLDYVFLADPTLYTPLKDPKRTLVVFIDTLRPDHMGVYGYERNTTPKLNVWAESAAVFKNARSVAPWTLPSARAAFSGHQPEAWGKVPRLSEQFAAKGWATGAFVGNIYLSANFEMSPGWDTYNVVNWPVGEVQADKVRAYLERHSDRDALVMIHLMDMHLPYTEPKSYQHLWAQDPPAGLKVDSTRKPILAAYRKNSEAVRQWVIDRYDQNMVYLDDVLSSLFEEIGEDSPVLIFSDHGEEFWDHQDFEHGHSLFDELLRVPFILKAPGIPAGTPEWPVSLLDVTPTVLEVSGLEAAPTVGRSVVGALKGDREAQSFFEKRLQAFGRPLYGQERWGVLDGALKWTSHRGEESVFDLAADPDEHKNLRASQDLTRYREAFEEGIQREGALVWRIAPGNASGRNKESLVVRVAHPTGFKAAWLGMDPLKRASMKLEEQPDGSFHIIFKKGSSGSREVFFAPLADVQDFEDLTLSVVRGAPDNSIGVAPALVGLVKPDGTAKSLIRGRLGNRSFTVTFASSPVPRADEELEAFDDEVSEALKALGYVH
jgi:arylsulfatase A-like enzyme